jgi:peptide subunit release factor 1 (eRF1)
MTVRYEYKCSACGNTYIEQRKAEEPQYFSNCSKCDTELKLVSETVFADDGSSTTEDKTEPTTSEPAAPKAGTFVRVEKN